MDDQNPCLSSCAAARAPACGRSRARPCPSNSSRCSATARRFRRRSSASQGRCSRRPIVITNHDYRFLVKEQLDEIGATAVIVTEPVAARFRPRRRRSDGALAARHGADTVVAVFAADHVVTEDRRVPCRSARKAAKAASRGYIVTLGVKPTEPAVGYGYIRPGARMWTRAPIAVEAFVEKPDLGHRRALCPKAAIFGTAVISFSAPTR